MVDLTHVTLASGVPVSGDGDVATINALMADGGQITLGFKADLPNVATDATPVSGISIWKQISKTLQAINALLPGALSATGGLKVQGDGTAMPVSIASIPSHAVTNSGSFKVQLAGGHTAIATATPGAAAIAAGDVVGGALSFIGAAASAQEIMVESVSLLLASAIRASEGAYRLHFYSVTPPSAIVDNGVWDLPSGDRASYLGFVDLTVPVNAGTSSAFIQINGLTHRLKTAGANLFGYLVTVAAFTETAVVHTVTLRTREV